MTFSWEVTALAAATSLAALRATSHQLPPPAHKQLKKRSVPTACAGSMTYRVRFAAACSAVLTRRLVPVCQPPVAHRTVSSARKFVDRAVVEAFGGAGGSGCVSFLREKYRPIGAPDGGDGGGGGSVIFRCSSSVRDLNLKTFHIRAANGMPGAGRCQSGKDGADVIVHVPVGTVVKLFKRGSSAPAAEEDDADREWNKLLRGKRELSAADARAHFDEVESPAGIEAASASGTAGAAA